MEFELDEQLPQPRRIGLSNAHGVQLQRDRKIPHALSCRVIHGSGEDRFQITVLDHQVARCFLADSLDAGNVVGAIADKGEVIGHVLRLDTEALGTVLHRYPLLLHAGRASATRVQ